MKVAQSPNPMTGEFIVAFGDGDHFDPAVPGLLLRVRGQAASWVYRYSSKTKLVNGRGVRREIGVGSARRTSPEAAQQAATTARALALQYASAVTLGRDPVEERQAERATKLKAAAEVQRKEERQRRTLGSVVRLYHEREIEGGSYTDKHCKAWIAIFEKHLKPYEDGALWTAPIDSIEPQQLLDFFKMLQKAVPHTARKARQRLDAVYEHAILKKWATSNPTKAIVRAVRRGGPSMKNTGHRALPYSEAPALFARLVELDSTAARCLRFTVLTAARTTEALHAEWSEIDLERRVWIIPAEKTKAREEHRVDLSDQAVQILQMQRGVDVRWVFPTCMRGAGRPMSSMAMLLQLRRLNTGGATTVHGLARSTFSTWANECGIARPDVIEAALGHREADLIRRAYNRSAFLSERRVLLQRWGDFLSPRQHAAANDAVDVALMEAS